MEKQNSVIYQSELEANFYVAKLMRVTAILMVVILALNIVGVFIIPFTPMLLACIGSIILLLIPTLLVNVLKLKQHFLKYIFVSIAVLFVSILIVVLSWHALIVYLYAIAIAGMYFEKRVNVLAVILSLVMFSLAQYISYIAGLTVDDNMENLYYLIVYAILPRAISLFAMALIFMGLNTRTTKMLKNLMDADAQTTMMAKMQKMTDRALEVSESLIKTVDELTSVTKNTSETNKLIAQSTELITDGSGETLRQINDVGDNVQSISENLNLLAERTNDIAVLSNDVHELTTNNSVNMDNAINEMVRISNSTEQNQVTIHELEDKSKEIINIVKVITNISMQTNILALNATIEAARAGQYGRGFTVVAAEIRRLASQTQNAVDDIKDIIDEVINGTTKAVDSMEESSSLVASGLDMIRIAEGSTRRVTVASEEMTSKISEIDSVTKDVAESSGRIVDIVHTVEGISSKNLDDLHGVTSATATGLKEMQNLSELVEGISEMSEKLNEVVHME